MTIISESVKDVLNGLLLLEVAGSGTMNFALDFTYELKKLDQSKSSTYASSN